MKKTAQFYSKNPKARAVKAAYDKKYNKEHSKDKNSRNKMRYKLMKEGRVRKNDGNDIDHINGNPQDNSKSNIRVVKKSFNRAKK
jgi:hypothetical protein